MEHNKLRDNDGAVQNFLQLQGQVKTGVHRILPISSSTITFLEKLKVKFQMMLANNYCSSPPLRSVNFRMDAGLVAIVEEEAGGQRGSVTAPSRTFHGTPKRVHIPSSCNISR